MARPIKETPFLTGKDAEKFIEENKQVTKITDEERVKINESFEALKDIAQFEI